MTSASARAAIATLAALQVGLGVVGLWANDGQPHIIPSGVFLAISLALAGVSALLFFGGRQDDRAKTMAVGYLVSAAAFSNQSLTSLLGSPMGDVAPVRLLVSCRVEAFLPYFAWSFVGRFPDVTRFGRASALRRNAATISIAVGSLLFAVGFVPLLGDVGRPLDLLIRGSGGLFWPVLLGLLLGTFPFALWKARHARPDERRRVGWLTLGVIVGMAPVLLVNALYLLVPPFAAWANRPSGARALGAISYPFILLAPFITSYAVLVHRALDVRVILGKAIQYALARHSLTVLVVVPFGLLSWTLIQNRDQTLAEIATGTTAIALMVVLLVGVIGVALRRRALRFVDRLFFREAYDAHRVLRDLARRSREAEDEAELGELLRGELGRALHVDRSGLLILDREAGALVPTSAGARPLGATNPLHRLLADGPRPIRVDWSRPGGIPERLGPDAAEWLADSGFRLLVPLISPGGELLGVLGMGEKRSELPYDRKDRELLSTVAESVALTIENRRLWATGSAGSGAAVDRPARECRGCGRVEDREHERCSACGGDLVDARLPLVLGGKYRLIERAGQGAMGVVYRGIDLVLGRDVAVKTLPRMSPRYSERLRREARAMASVSHPNLALIFASEIWFGAPVLMFEFLPGGTLADRLANAPLEPVEALVLGRRLAGVAACIHDAGILHRDIKPSNIGFTAGGEPKLMDFGLARLLEVSRAASEADAAPPIDAARHAAGATGQDADARDRLTASSDVLGTIIYMCPEALQAAEPGPAFDLWSIGVVVYEAMTGLHPFAARTPYLSMLRIADGDATPLRESRPGLPEPLDAFFRAALSSNPRRRPQTARELGSQLDELRSLL